MTLDIASIQRELKNLQSRLEKYEDLLIEGSGDKEHNIKMLEYYKHEASKMRNELVNSGKVDNV